jgi:glycosyltransferase involved in cell wall biosynthesis
MLMAVFEKQKYDIVYSSSDFLPDVLSGFIMRVRGHKWIAGYYLHAFKENKIHYWTQRLCKFLIDKYADMVIVTNPTMYHLFPDKKKTWINGGINMKLAGLSDEPKIYDAVFCGRIHWSKGIDELCEIWKLVRKAKPNARLAIIGDGDLGVRYIRQRIGWNHGVTLFGYMGDERYKIYKQSKIVLYPVPKKYDHFSMAPVEAMACGCTMVCFNNPVMNIMLGKDGENYEDSTNDFANDVLSLLSTDVILDFMGAVEFAKQFDYEKQVMRVYDDIRKELYENTDNRLNGDGRNSAEAFSKES